MVQLGPKISFSIGRKAGYDTLQTTNCYRACNLYYLTVNKTVVFRIGGEDPAHNGIEIILTAGRRTFTSHNHFENLIL